MKKRKRLRRVSGLDRRAYESKTEWCADAHFIIKENMELVPWDNRPMNLLIFGKN